VIALLASGLAGQAVQFLDAAGFVSVLNNVLWDSSAFLPEDGLFGRVLHALIGYTARPTELQLMAYIGVLIVMALLMRIARPPAPKEALAR
jgi:high-affinity iron transporter